jgi:hypothetical protein
LQDGLAAVEKLHFAMASSWWSGGAGLGYVNIRPDDSDADSNERRTQRIIEAPAGWGVAYATHEDHYSGDSTHTHTENDTEVEAGSRRR